MATLDERAETMREGMARVPPPAESYCIACDRRHALGDPDCKRQEKQPAAPDLFAGS